MSESCKCKELPSAAASPWKCDRCGREWTLLVGWRVTNEGPQREHKEAE